MSDDATIPPRDGEGDRPPEPQAKAGGGGVFATTGKTIRRARKERRSGNLPEIALWRELRKRPGGFRFRRQHPVGPYILDFACLRPRVAIEVDGMVHEMGDGPQHDARRDAFVAGRGFLTLRFAAKDVLNNLEGVVIAIAEACRGQPLHHAVHGPPPHIGEVF